jgi:glutamyl/glutaminyl-tRNA synthetase
MAKKCSINGINMTLRTRIAPTPSGFLHPGNGVSFIITWAIARKMGGKIVLRIDDLDTERLRPEYVEDIFRTLDWLGLDYDEGPMSVADFNKNYSQHKRLDLYSDALEKLKNNQFATLYACNCSRKQIRENAETGIYPHICRTKNIDFDGTDTSWRILVPDKTLVSFQEFQKEPLSIRLDETMGDFIVRQKNGLPAYQIASLVDDVHFNINFIVRGQDLLDSTAAQEFLAENLSLSTPKTYLHHPLLTDTEGVKLSKSLGAGSLKDWREHGRSPLALFEKAAEWLGMEIIN